MNSLKRIAKVLCLFMLHLWMSASLRDGDRDGKAKTMETSSDTGSEAAMEKAHAQMREFAVGRNSFTRQKPHHLKDDVLVEDEPTEEEKNLRLQDRVLEDAMEEAVDDKHAEASAFVELEQQASGNESRHEQKSMPKSSVRTGRRLHENQRIFGHCRNLEVKGLGCHGKNADSQSDDIWVIRRARSARQKTMLGVGVLMILAVVALGIMSMGLVFSSLAIVAPAASVVSAGTSAFFGWFNAMLFSTTSALVLGSVFTVAIGVTSGVYLESAASETGVEFNEWSQNNKMTDDMSWLTKLGDKCSVIQFEGAFGGAYLSQYEESTHVKANWAVRHWCHMMDTVGSSGTEHRGLFEQPGVMPKPSVCVENSKPSRKRQTRGPDRYFNCYDMMRLSNEELAFQTTLMTMTVMQKMREGQAKKSPCPQTLIVPAPVNVIPQACAEDGEGGDINKLFKAEKGPAGPGQTPVPRALGPTYDGEDGDINRLSSHTYVPTPTYGSSHTYVPTPTYGSSYTDVTPTNGSSHTNVPHQVLRNGATYETYVPQYIPTNHAAAGRDHAEAGLDHTAAKTVSLVQQQVDKTGQDLSHVSVTDLIDVREEREAGNSTNSTRWPWSEKKFEGLAEDTSGIDHNKMQGINFDPNKPYKAPPKVTVSPEEKEALIKATRDKEEAMHNCLSIVSCQLLRKEVEKMKGRTKKWYTLWLANHQTKDDMLDKIIVRCLAHSDLVGPAWNGNCKACPRGALGSKWSKKGNKCKA